MRCDIQVPQGYLYKCMSQTDETPKVAAKLLVLVVHVLRTLALKVSRDHIASIEPFR